MAKYLELIEKAREGWCAGARNGEVGGGLGTEAGRRQDHEAERWAESANEGGGT